MDQLFIFPSQSQENTSVGLMKFNLHLRADFFSVCLVRVFVFGTFEFVAQHQFEWFPGSSHSFCFHDLCEWSGEET